MAKKENVILEGIWQQKWYCKQIYAHCAFLNVSRRTEEIREPWNQ